VHAHDADTLFVALLVRLMAKIPFVYDAHELWEARLTASWSWVARYYRWMLNRAARQWAGTITVSPGIQAWMVERFSLATEPTLVRNCPSEASIPARESKGSLRVRADVPDGCQLLVHVGSMGPNRGVVEAIEALKLLPPNVFLVLIGSADQRSRDRVASAAEQHGVLDRVRLVSPVPEDEVPTVIQDADASVVYPQGRSLNSLYSLPNKLFQSIQAGLPVVGSDAPDVADIITSLGIGPIAPAYNVPALARAIEDALNSGSTYREAARAAAPVITWEHEFPNADSLYRSVLAARDPSVRNARIHSPNAAKPRSR
jgi:glycosyltransferase involved in cell wall biosynthesis